MGKQVGKTASDVKDYALEKNPLLKDKKLQDAIIGGAAIVGTAVIGTIIGDMMADSICEASPQVDISEIVPNQVFLPEIDVNSISGIENSIVYDNADIQALSDLGMKPELIDNHIDSNLIERSDAIKMDFLHSIGYNEVPQGFEVRLHQIITRKKQNYRKPHLD